MSLIRQLAGETVIYGVSTILPRILHFVVFTVYLTNRVFAQDPESFGIYTDLYAYAALLLVLFTYRLDTAYFRYGHQGKNERQVFSTSAIALLMSSLVLVGLLVLMRNQIAGWLTYPDDGRYVVYFAAIIGLDALASIAFARLRLTNQARRFALIKILNVVVNLVFVFAFLEVIPNLIERGHHTLESIYQPHRRLDLLFIANLIASAIVLLLLLPQFRRVRFTAFSPTTLRKMLIYLAPLVVVGLAGVFNQSFAVPLIKYLLPAINVKAEMGIYAAVAKLAILMNLFTMAFNYAAEPFFFKQSESKGAPHLYAEVAHAFSIVASTVLLGILLYLDVLQYLIGQTYREGLYIVPILLVAYWFLGLYYNFSVWYKITDKTRYGALFSSLGVIVTLLVTISLIETYGKVTLAWAALACYFTMNVLAFVIGRKHYRIPYPLARMVSYLVGALFVYACWHLLTDQLSQLGWRLVCSTLCLAGYLVTVYVVNKGQIKKWFA